MDFKAALAAIKGLENGAELVSAIEGETSRLEAKAYETIGESRKATAKARVLTEALEAVGKLLGIEGDADAIASNLDGKIRSITTELGTLKTEKTALETRATEAETKVQSLERTGKLAQIATKIGADAKALEKLLGDKLGDFAIAEDGSVTVGGKPYQEFVQGSEDLKPFASVLLPAQDQKQEQKPQPKVALPTGSPKGTSTSADPLAAYTSRNYSGIKAFTKTGT